ncbi:MAG: helix-turn-helix domain-containing protein [Thiohalocapsa sp.]
MSEHGRRDRPSAALSRCQTGRGVLNLNEQKIYALVSEGCIPGTKVTGKWIFPRELIDRWMLESSPGALLTDRLMLAGSDDPLLHRVVQSLARDTDARAMVSYSPTGTRLGLEPLQFSSRGRLRPALGPETGKPPPAPRPVESIRRPPTWGADPGP